MDDSEDPSSTWDFSYLLDFNLDEDHTDNSLPFSSLFNDAPEIPNDRVRKRDPRLTCSNFLAGRVPCACPELDAKLEDEGLPGKKRARTARASSSARCQVPGCEVDISELKGYHRRHRVCLLCANATTVVLHGEPKRYCQQCGKFHVLSDFDEGKRSCRRKLERHNTRRRRKPLVESGGGAIAELEAVTQNEENNYDAVAGKDCSNLSNEINDIVVLPDHGEEPVPILVSAPDAQNVNSDSVVSLPVSGETRVNSGNTSNSPSYCDNKSAYTSMLRKESLEHVNKLVAPGNMLSGRGTALVHLNDIVFRVMKDGTSVTKVEVSLQAPRLHYVHPTCFEAGKPMEFVACGSNLLQPKFQYVMAASSNNFNKFSLHIIEHVGLHLC
ncbi:hypothetical protein LR48_Vigan09g217300 [Vigna angularis]|uniref:SBP-type domain-containing protein n=1 Tax=Phaseolus angularis TaxID=3914 RepID=A0A0L9VFS6_PHAAN|nr:hypothetical protein LR48_Vigan09g217300 [Vigna angularis]